MLAGAHDGLQVVWGGALYWQGGGRAQGIERCSPMVHAVQVVLRWKGQNKQQKPAG